MRIKMDPGGAFARWWNEIFFVAMMASLFIDPLFFFSLKARDGSELCIETEVTLDVIFTMLRSIDDVFYWVHIIVQFKMGYYMAPSSRELVLDSKKIALRYLRQPFWMDLLAALPIPQVLVWGVIPNVSASVTWDPKIGVRCLILIQYLYRLFRIYPLSMQAMNATGAVSQKIWRRVAHNLLLFYVASHISGACWYLFTIERQESCWKSVCDLEKQSCGYQFFDCSMTNIPRQSSWLTSSNVTTMCDPNNSNYQFGIYAVAVTTGASSSAFPYKYSCALWLGLQSICASGQNLFTSIYIVENIYAIIVGTLGLLLVASLILNMRTFLLSVTEKLEEWRLKKNDIEEWIHYRQLPLELKLHVQRYIRQKWLATRGIDEKSLLDAFPSYLQRDIKRQLCLDLVQRVPVFAEMDELILDVICEKLEPEVYTKGTYLIREGDPVTDMFFIIRGELNSSTTDGGHSRFFSSCQITGGGFCGEELLIWFLDNNPIDSLPPSTWTVQALSNVETFCLSADSLKFILTQFPTLRSKKLRHKFKFYSLQWRTWAACYIQATWRRYKRRKVLVVTCNFDNSAMASTKEANHEIDIFVPRPDAGIEVYAARLITNIRKEKSKRFT